MNLETKKHSIETLPTEEVKEKPEIKNPEIADLEIPIHRLLVHLKERIDRGDYQLLIGDDASGRIPARVFEIIIKEIYKERGYALPETQFFAGSKDLVVFDKEKARKKTKKLKAYLEKVIAEKKLESLKSEKRALVITDMIASGNSLKPLAEALKDSNINFDIATIGIEDSSYSNRNFLEEKLGAQIFYGKTGTPHIYSEPHLSGVLKDVEDIFSKPFKNFYPREETKQQEIQSTVNQSREDAAVLANNLIGYYKNLPSEK